MALRWLRLRSCGKGTLSPGGLAGGWFAEGDIRQCSGNASLPKKSSDLEVAGESILLPRKKTWDKVAVLQALASTVQRDITAAHYLFQDDPYLTPRTSVEYRLFSLSKESGKNAAQYVFKKHPQYFAKDIAEPHIPSFVPETTALPLEEVNEDALKYLIELRKVKASVSKYDQLLQAGTSVSLETTNSLLDLLCFYGDNEPNLENSPEANELEELEEPPEEESKKGKFQNTAQRFGMRWRRNNNAERIFNLMPEKNAHSFCTMIRGMVKHGAYENAFSTYTELLNNRLTADVYTFNALILAAGNIKEKGSEKWELVEDLLKQMAQQNVQPNLLTFNSALKILRWCGHLGKSPSLKILGEMKALNIEPSLATYDHLLGVFYKSGTLAHSPPAVIYEIVNEIKGKSFYPQDPDDGNFFSSAMKIDLLKQMAQQNVQPNLLTFNSALKILRWCGHLGKSPSLKILGEMKALNIEPSLATYDHLLGVFYKSGTLAHSPPAVIYEIVNEIKGKSFYPQDPDDGNFFSSAMKICLLLKDVQLAYEVHKIVETAENRKMLGNMNMQASYCGRFFQLLCLMEQLDVVLKWYKDLIPSMFYPNSQGLLDLLQALDAGSHLEMIPQIWKDIKYFKHSHRPDLVEEVLGLMARDVQSPETQAAFADCAADVLSSCEGQGMSYPHTASSLGNTTLLFARAGRISEAWNTLELFKKYNRIPSDLVIDELFSCIKKTNRPDQALELVKLAADFSVQSTSKLARAVQEEFQLSEEQRAALAEIVGESSDSNDDE